MLFDRLFDKYEELIDGVLYVVEYYEPVIFPCELMYRVKLYVIQNGSKRCVLSSSSNNNLVPVSDWVEQLKEKGARLSRIKSNTSKMTNVTLPALQQDFVTESERIQRGDRVKLSEKALKNFNAPLRDFMSKMVYEVVDIDASVFQGVVLKLHCGTTLLADEAVKVDKNTRLRT